MAEKKGLSLKDLLARPDVGKKAPLKERLSEEEYKRRERKSNIVVFSIIGMAVILGIIAGFMMTPGY